MKPSATAVLMLFLLAGAGLVEAGRAGGREAKGSWGKGHGRRQEFRDERRHSDAPRRRREDSREHSSRRRRRRSKSDSRTPDKRKSSEKPAEAKESPGYLEYKQQKQEALAWQERRLQAQALALCLEEREQQRPASREQMASVQSQPSAVQSTGQAQVPPLPEHKKPVEPTERTPDFFTGSSKPSTPRNSRDGSPEELIPLSSLRLVEAELGHCLSLGNKPLTSEALEKRLAAAKPKGKMMDAFITRYGNDKKTPPTRITAKAKLMASIVKGLPAWDTYILVGCFFSGFLIGGFVVFFTVLLYPQNRHWEGLKAWWTLHVTHADLAGYWLTGIPVVGWGATLAVASVIQRTVQAYLVAP